MILLGGVVWEGNWEGDFLEITDDPSQTTFLPTPYGSEPLVVAPHSVLRDLDLLPLPMVPSEPYVRSTCRPTVTYPLCIIPHLDSRMSVWVQHASFSAGCTFRMLRLQVRVPL